MKRIIINESQLHLITEANGVSDKMMKVAQAMAESVVNEALAEILNNGSLIEEWLDDYDSEYTNYVEVDARNTSILFFMTEEPMVNCAVNGMAIL